MKMLMILGAAALAIISGIFAPSLIAPMLVTAFLLSLLMRRIAMPTRCATVLAVYGLALSFSQAAFAQSSAIDAGGIYGAWQPYILAVVMPAAAAIVGLLCEILRRKWNLDIEARHREALQTALTNGAGVALNKLGNSLQGKTIDVGNVAVAAGVNYVMKAAPAAMAKFGLTPEVVAEKITAKLPQVANTTTPVSG